MSIEITDLSPVKKQLAVEIGVEDLESETEKVVQGFRAEAKIPGFRKGKAPRSVIRSHFSKEIQEEVRDRVIARSFAEAAKENSLRPIGNPAVEELSHEEGEPLSFKTTFEVFPEIELADYKELEVQRPSAAVLDEEVDKTVEELRQARAHHVTEEGRTAVEGDVVVADIEGTPEEGESFSRERMGIEIGAEQNLPAFNENLVGKSAEDEVEFSVEYPEEYQAKNLAGQKVTYKATVREVKRREVPALDDEFAKDLGEFEDLAALKARVREDLEARKSAEADGAVRNALLDKLLLGHPIVLPDLLVEAEVKHRLQDVVRNMMMQGIDPEKVEIDWEDLRKKQDEPARKAVHARLVLDALAEAEGLAVDDRELKERIGLEAARMGEKPEELRKRLRESGGIEALKNQLLREKSLDYLTSVANILNSD